MDKFNAMIYLFLAVLFALTGVFHMLYVKGHIFEMARESYIIESETSTLLAAMPYKDQHECEGASGLDCLYEQCDYVPMEIDIDKVCGTDNKAWFPIVEQSTIDRKTPHTPH